MPIFFRKSLVYDNSCKCIFFCSQKVLDYGEISVRESTVIGRKGKRAYPPQFQYPSSVAVDIGLGNIYVADYGNARIQILELNGDMAREPLVLGGKCRPCALAVSLRGDLVMTDSQILRVFSKTGKLTWVRYTDLLIKEPVTIL